MRKLFFVLLCLFMFPLQMAAQVSDTPFVQPVSVKYHPDQEIQGSILKKVVVDDNDVVYVLTSNGLCRTNGQKIVKDLRYRPLADRIPLDVAIQEHTGYLYYLYQNSFLSNADAGKPYGNLPEGRYNKIAVAADGNILLAGDRVLGFFSKGKLHPVAFGGGRIIAIRAYKGIFYVLCAGGVYHLSDGRLLAIHQGDGLKAFTFKGDEMLLGTTAGYYGVNILTGDTSLSMQRKIPIRDIDQLVMVQGKLWAGTDHGAFMKRDTGGFNYYASRRWLNEDSVISMAADSKGNIYLLTPTGLNEIRFTRQTFLQKAQYFEHIIRQRHIRYGLLAAVRMKTPGDLATAELIDTDNDGLWTSFYLGSQAFRYAVTGDSMASRYAWESFSAYERLLSINPLKGFPARSFARSGVSVSDPSAWRPSQDSGWQWKGTTSSDEFVGYIFVGSVMDAFVAKTKAEHTRVADFIDKILSHIIANHYNFVDVDGKPTLWGRWNPEYINGYARTISDRKLGSTDLIAGLELGYALTGKALYKTEALRLMNKDGYLDNILISPYDIKATPGYSYQGHDMGMGPWNHSDDEMEFLSYWVLYHYAFNKTLQQKFGKVIREYWKIEAPEKNPVWNLITLGTEGSFDKKATLWYMREFPVDQIRWTIDNTIRRDLIFLKPNFRQQLTEKVLSPEEQPIHRYNANAFDLKGGDGGRTELTGAEYLLPYWMARYLKVLGR